MTYENDEQLLKKAPMEIEVITEPSKIEEEMDLPPDQSRKPVTIATFEWEYKQPLHMESIRVIVPAWGLEGEHALVMYQDGGWSGRKTFTWYRANQNRPGEKPVDYTVVGELDGKRYLIYRGKT